MAPQAQALSILARILQGAKQGAMQGIGGLPPSAGPGRNPLTAQAQSPSATPAPTPPAPGQAPQGQTATTAAPAYNIPRPPSGGPATASGAPVPQPHEQINSLAQLILGWKQRDYNKKAAEMQNVWTDLMEAIDASRDPQQAQKAQQMIELIMERHGKDLAKFFKGRFEEVKKQQSKAGEQKEPDPTEQGLEAALQDRQKQAAPQAQPPSAGGYYLPMAGPEAQLKNLQTSTELAAGRQDPSRMLQSQLTGGERRQQELATAGLAVTPRVEAELKKYSLEVIRAQSEADKAMSEFKAAEQRALMTGKRDEAEIEKLRIGQQTASIKLDIARQQLQRERSKTKNQQQMSQSFRLKFGMIQQAEAAINQLIGSKQGITGENVANVINLLKAAGATGIASDLQNQQKTWWKSYSKPEDLLKGLQAYKDAFQQSFKLDQQGGAQDEGEPDDTEPEGATPEGDQDLPPGWNRPPATEPGKP